jgi:hypothetical protein
MVSVVETVNISQLEAAFNTDLGDQQNPLQTALFILAVSSNDMNPLEDRMEIWMG